MGAIIEKIPRQSQESFLSGLQRQNKQSRPTIVAIKFPGQHLERILAPISNNGIKGLTVVDSTLRYHRARYRAQLRRQPIQNILAVTPTAWQGWEHVSDELYAHSGGKVYLLDNSMEASYCADKEMVLNEKGGIVAERDVGCFC